MTDTPPAAPSARRKPRAKPKTSKVKPGAKRRVDPADVDPEFLTDAELARREAFAQAYVALGHYGPAAEKAGYTGKPDSLRKQGWRLINEPAVRARVEAIRENALLELGITQRDVLAELHRMAFFDIGKCFDENGNMLPANEIPLNTRRALAGYEIEEKTFGGGDDVVTIVNRKIKGPNKDAALDKLRQHVGLMTPQERGDSLTLDSFLARLSAGVERARQRQIEQQPSIPARFVSADDGSRRTSE